MNIGIESGGDVDEPSRDPRTGHFLPGNKASQGNPQAKKVSALRAAIMDCSSTADVQKVMRSLLRMAQNDNVYACREWLDRVVGKPVDSNPQQNNSLVVQLLQQNEQDRILLESPEARQLAGQWTRMIANKRDVSPGNGSPGNIDGGDE